MINCKSITKEQQSEQPDLTGYPKVYVLDKSSHIHITIITFHYHNLLLYNTFIVLYLLSNNFSDEICFM